MIYVKIRWTGDLQKNTGVMNKRRMPAMRHMKKEEIERFWSSKMLQGTYQYQGALKEVFVEANPNPSEVFKVSARIREASSSSKW